MNGMYNFIDKNKVMFNFIDKIKVMYQFIDKNNVLPIKWNACITSMIKSVFNRSVFLFCVKTVGFHQNGIPAVGMVVDLPGLLDPDSLWIGVWQGLRSVDSMGPFTTSLQY